MTATNVRVQMQQRRDTAANWTSADPTLLAGEFGYESDTGKLKVGDGSTAWSSLAYEPGFSLSAYPLATADIADDAITAAKLADTAVTAGSYVAADITVDAQGRITAASNAASIDLSGTLDVTGNATFDSDCTIQGDLTVNGTTTTIDTVNLVVEDKNIELGSVTTPTDVTADGGGITLKGTTDKTINWVDATDAWTSSERFDFPAGTEGAPSIILNGDVNSGIYQPGADQVAISTGGTGRLFIDSSGRVGVGTTSAIQRLQINGNTLISNNNYHYGYNSDGAQTSLIGISSGNSVVVGQNNVNHVNTIVHGGTGSINLHTSGTERARIDNSGRLLVGTSSGSGNSTAHFQGNAGASIGGAFLSLQRGAANPTSGTELATISFADNAPSQGARIQAFTDGDWAASDYPTRLMFFTTADGASSPTERVRIESNGKTKFSGGVYGVETTITASDFDLNDGNFFTCGAIAIPNPTNGVAGMSGLIRVTAAPTSFGSNWDFPGGSYTAPTAFPAVAPFYIVSSTQFYLGNWTENIT